MMEKKIDGPSAVLPLESTSVELKRSFLSSLWARDDPDRLGQEMLQRSLQYDRAQLEADSVKVRRKLDFIVLPMVCPEFRRPVVLGS